MLYHLLFGSGRMQTFTVHESPIHAVDRIDRAEALVFVKDGFSGQAFIFAPLWLLARRLWVGLSLYLAAAVAILAAQEWLGLPFGSAVVAFIGLHGLVGYEADSIQRLSLEQRGWQSLGSVTGTSALDCERRFFDTWLHGQPVLAPRAAPVGTPAHAADAAEQPAARNATSRGSAAGRLAALWRRDR